MHRDADRLELQQELRDALVRLRDYRHVALHAVAFAHELRNPLAALALQLELDLASEQDESRRRSMQAMLRACEEAVTLTTTFLQSTREASSPLSR